MGFAEQNEFAWPGGAARYPQQSRTAHYQNRTNSLRPWAEVLDLQNGTNLLDRSSCKIRNRTNFHGPEGTARFCGTRWTGQANRRIDFHRTEPIPPGRADAAKLPNRTIP